MSKETAKKYFEKGCNEYLRLFCEKHGFDYEDAKQSWVANEVGDIVCVGDYFVEIETIIADIEMDAPEEDFEEWYDYTIEAVEFKIPTPNFKSWILGCPRTDEATLERLRRIKLELQELINKEKERLRDETKTTSQIFEA